MATTNPLQRRLATTTDQNLQPTPTRPPQEAHSHRCRVASRHNHRKDRTMSLIQRLFGRPDDGDADRDYQLRRIREADAHAARQHQRQDAEVYLSQQRRDIQDAIDQQRRDDHTYDDRRYRDSYRSDDSRDRDCW